MQLCIGSRRLRHRRFALRGRGWMAQMAWHIGNMRLGSTSSGRNVGGLCFGLKAEGEIVFTWS